MAKRIISFNIYASRIFHCFLCKYYRHTSVLLLQTLPSDMRRQPNRPVRGDRHYRPSGEPSPILEAADSGRSPPFCRGDQADPQQRTTSPAVRVVIAVYQLLDFRAAILKEITACRLLMNFHGQFLNILKFSIYTCFIYISTKVCMSVNVKICNASNVLIWRLRYATPQMY